MTGFVLLRVGAHRLLLAAALLAVVLTTCVLAALTAFSGSVGDAALRHTLGGREAANASLVVTAQVPGERRASAHEAVVRGARTSFGGLPVTVRKLERSGPYALPRSLQAPEARKGEPDLTHFAALDATRVRTVAGALPGPAGDGPVPVALPETAAELLDVRPEALLTLTDRLTEKPLKVRVTGVYRATDPADPYWQLDSLGGRGVRTVVFTTYGPLLADPSVLASGRATAGETAWLATADFRTVGTDRIGALRSAAGRGPEQLARDPAFGGAPTVRTKLPTVLAQSERALLVARSTLLIVAVQLVVLAAYTLLLVARMLSSERAGETGLLRARGASRGRIAALAAIEAALLALPAAVCAPLLAGPLTRLLAEHSALTRAGLRLGEAPTAQVWLVAGAVAVCCAAAVVAPALAATGDGPRRGRGRALPAPVRAGADVALLAVAVVAYWQLDRRTGATGGGALSGDREGDLGVDPLLVAAPALALLAGTVLTLRLLPPVAKLAERRAAGGRGLSVALAGWQFSRRPLRGAGPVLLLVLAVAMGMLAVGQSASWDRSQRDQADFRAGASVRVTDDGTGGPGDAGLYASLAGVRTAAPAHRAALPLSGDRTATVLALDTADADEGLLMRGDLALEEPAALLAALAPAKSARAGLLLPDDTRRVTLDVHLTNEGTRSGPSPGGLSLRAVAVFEDRHGTAHRTSAGELPVDGRVHPVTLDLDGTASGGRAAPAGPLALTGLRLLDAPVPTKAERHRLSVERVLAAGPEGGFRPVEVPSGLRWAGTYTETWGREAQKPVPVRADEPGAKPLSVGYEAGPAPVVTDDPWSPAAEFAVQVAAVRPAAPQRIPAVATDAFLDASGAKRGDSVDVALGGEEVRVTIVRAVRQLPTTGPAAVTAGGRVPSGQDGDQAADGGGLLLDLRTVNEALARLSGTSLRPTEWWLSTAVGKAAPAAAELRARPDAEPDQVLVRDETAGDLLGDPLGAGPRSALLAVAVVAVALAAVGFAVSAAGSLRERAAEFAVLRALGTPRRRLARLVAAEQSVLIGIALLVGLALGTVLTRAVVPLLVLTGQATQPVPRVLVELPADRVGLLLAAVAALPLVTVAVIALRRADPAVTLRHQGDN
ncbi:ABC transporter permease [Streptomyces sp. PKU-EA00015]|uniref:ABC transporter permease n=1 Tax=Streptomyces sp. PKU-EA00015 TaxID=2748326 RepID=UPI0015A011C3|nr:ABC transporter permease [Streptomyces sp. PKU-EA00015]NWF28399.1 ABC transporter permease [Streptomyces sp. PKU-EA00015]